MLSEHTMHIIKITPALSDLTSWEHEEEQVAIQIMVIRIGMPENYCESKDKGSNFICPGGKYKTKQKGKKKELQYSGI